MITRRTRPLPGYSEFTTHTSALQRAIRAMKLLGRRMLLNQQIRDTHAAIRNLRYCMTSDAAELGALQATEQGNCPQARALAMQLEFDQEQLQFWHQHMARLRSDRAQLNHFG